MLLKTIQITICEACLNGEGQECHTPGCALFLHKVDLPICKELYTIIATQPLKPETSNTIKIMKIGNEWCALLGPTMKEGFASYGPTPRTALLNLVFDLEGKGWEPISTSKNPTKK